MRSGLFQLILWILAIYFGYHLLLKPLFRIFIQQAIRKVVNDQFKQHGGQHQSQQRHKPEGTISVDYIPEKKKKESIKTDKMGEYVDYEEVK